MNIETKAKIDFTEHAEVKQSLQVITKNQNVITALEKEIKKEKEWLREQLCDFSNQEKPFVNYEDGSLVEIEIHNEKKIICDENWILSEIDNLQEKIYILQNELDNLKNGKEPKTKITTGFIKVVQKLKSKINT